MDTLSSQVRSSSQVNQDGSSSELMTPEKARVWLDCMRPMLLAMAKEMIGPDLQSKFGASDIVQQTYVDAIGDLPRLNLSRKRQLIGWLTVLLRNNMRDAARTFRSSLKRAVVAFHERSSNPFEPQPLFRRGRKEAAGLEGDFAIGDG